MSDLLATFTGNDTNSDAEIVDRIAAYRPDRVTILVTGQDAELTAAESGDGDALRDRIAGLMATIERRTGATVVGLAGDRAQLAGWRFDRELGGRVPVAV